MDRQIICTENESGVFEVDPQGCLTAFRAAEGNAAESPDPEYSRAVRHLRIPEGVRYIGNIKDRQRNERFRNLLILEDLTFPRSLLAIGDFSFECCGIGRMVIPPELKKIGRGTFYRCRIGDLTVRKEFLEYCDQEADEETLLECPENKLIFGGRSFKESTVGRVTVVGRELFRYSAGSRRLYILPEKTRLTTSEWIRVLMPEADVRMIDRRM